MTDWMNNFVKPSWSAFLMSLPAEESQNMHLIVILDRASTHVSAFPAGVPIRHDIDVAFIGAETTKYCQPLDVGSLFRSLKAWLRRQLLNGDIGRELAAVWRACKFSYQPQYSDAHQFLRCGYSPDSRSAIALLHGRLQTFLLEGQQVNIFTEPAGAGATNPPASGDDEGEASDGAYSDDVEFHESSAENVAGAEQ
ncbi:unnamed protein product [Amoebophrya sp. A25]|nr:unnamed protein product [Amoebophrya sp. A25]|eukprot:GSA25T00001901001.1